MILEISSKGRDAMLALLDEYPHGCLRPTWKYTNVDHVQVSCVALTLHFVLKTIFVPPVVSFYSLIAHTGSCLSDLYLYLHQNITYICSVDVHARCRSPFEWPMPPLPSHSEPVQVRRFVRQVQHQSSSEESLRWLCSRTHAACSFPPVGR